MIYSITLDKTYGPKPVETKTLSALGWSEKDLENYLFAHLPDFVSEDLMVIGQSSPFQETVDLVALDREGDLWLFELKKVQGTSENLLQVLRYSQLFAQASFDDLDQIFRRFRNVKDRSLAVAFCDHFGFDSSAAPSWADRLGKRHHLVVVTDGTDDDSLSAINHWQRHGLDVQAWPYRVYSGDSDSFKLDFPELFASGRRVSRRPASVFIVNTSRKGESRSNNEDFMREKECALVTSEPWIWKIFNIPTGSKVMLYANRVGIIAVGIATGERRMEDLNGEKAHYVRLRDFRVLARPLTTQEITNVADKKYRYQSVMELHGDAGPKVWEAACARR